MRFGDAPLTREEAAELARLLDRSPSDWSYARTEGYFTATASAPTVTARLAWPGRPLVEGAWGSPSDRANAFELLLRLEQSLNEVMWSEELVAWTDFDDPDELRAWCRGYLEAVALEDEWREDEPGAPGLDALRVLAGARPATSEEAERAKAELVDRVLDQHVYRAPRFDPESAIEFVLDLEPPANSRRVGRNRPCPCGSGAKWKRCCGRA